MTVTVTGATVLLAEDDEALVALVHATFRRSDLRLLDARTGPAALAAARQERPDVLLLDVGLPGTDGYEVCRALKDDPRTAGIEIVMLTARAAAADVERAEQVGADGYLTKPFSPRDLAAEVHRRLAGRRAAP